MISVFDEKKYAEEMIKNGFLSRKYQFELRILAKYYKFVENKKPKQIKSIIVAFCEKNLYGFNFNCDFAFINSVISYLKSKKCQFIIIDGIWVSEEYVQFFCNLDCEYDIKKLLFTIGIWGKINLELGHSEAYAASFDNYRDLKNSAGVKMKGDIYYNVFHKFFDEKTIRMTHRGTLHNLFLAKVVEGDSIYKITDLKNLGAWFDSYNGINRIYLCEECGKPFQKKSNKTTVFKFCPNCSKAKKEKTILFTCEKCGEHSFVSSKSHNKKMCKSCFQQHQKEYNRSKYKEKFKTTK
jgi:hypothetical protein